MFKKPFSIRKKHIILLSAVAMLLSAVVFVVWPEKKDLNNFDNNLVLQNGDVVFRKGQSLTSRVVLMTDRESSYSHVGVVCILNQVPYVVHAVPDESENDIDYVKMERLSNFFSSEKACKGSIFRIKKQYSKSAQSAALTAKSYYDNKILFDDAFSMDSENKLYCTELVWKAYQKAGINLIQGNLDKLSFPFIKDFIVMPSSLLKSSYLEEIYYF